MTTPPAVVRIGTDRRFVAGPTRLSMALLLAILIADVTPAAAGDVPCTVPTSGPLAQERMVGLFTGKLVNGTPVYRLPSITVSASKAELARVEREERLARARQARAKTAARPPA